MDTDNACVYLLRVLNNSICHSMEYNLSVTFVDDMVNDCRYYLNALVCCEINSL